MHATKVELAETKKKNANSHIINNHEHRLQTREEDENREPRDQ